MQIKTQEQDFFSFPGLSTLTTPELCQVSDTEGHFNYASGPFTHVLQPESAGDGIVRFNPKQMDQDTPYPFRMSGSWFIALKRQEGHIDFLFIP